MKRITLKKFGCEWSIFDNKKEVGVFYFSRELLQGVPQTEGTLINLRNDEKISLDGFSYFKDVKQFVVSYFQKYEDSPDELAAH